MSFGGRPENEYSRDAGVNMMPVSGISGELTYHTIHTATRRMKLLIFVLVSLKILISKI